MLLKNHLDMIGRNEPVTRKARFWQSYVRALKGSDDLRAPEPSVRPRRGLFRPLLADFPELAHSWPLTKSIYDDPSLAADRMAVPGYRYLPVSRETYGYSPRNLYPGLPYTAADRYRPESWIDPRAWRDRLERLDRLGPAGAYWMSPLRGRSSSPMPRAGSVPPMPLRTSSPPPRRSYTPPPEAPSEKQVAFNYAGQPIYTRGGITRRPLSELLEPLTSLPMSRITRDPWWWEYPELRPYVSPWSLPSHAPFYLRDSYLSPVKRSYLWSKHPIRPFGYNPLRLVDWWDI
ncbi:hypothetical protein R5R35_005327 [Gryllus longicercus]|uniref:Myofilin n=1 Tax=Gryllus longicercus TaxID=2509291 RepID=A0AAN9VU03_9ORTH